MAVVKNASDLTDMASFVAYCSSDQTMLLALEATSIELWLPCSRVTGDKTVIQTVIADVTDVFGVAIPPNRVLRHCKVWLPNHITGSLSHIIFHVSVTMDDRNKSKNTNGRFKGKLRWVNGADLDKLSSNMGLRSPELIELYQMAKGNTAAPDKLTNFAMPPELLWAGPGYVEMGKNVLGDNAKTSSPYEQLVQASELDAKSQECLWKQFLVLSFPCMYMGCVAFGKLAVETGWSKIDAVPLFRSADLNARSGLSFRELMYFLAAVEVNTPHSGSSAELRCRYIFRYLDKQNAGTLRLEDLNNLISMIRKSKKESLEKAAVSKEVTEAYKAMGVPETQLLSINEFLKAVGELKIRGTSQIFRAPMSAVKYAKDLLDREAKAKGAPVRVSPTTGAANIAGVGSNSFPASASKASTGTTGKGAAVTKSGYAKSMQYELAVHTVKIQKSGTAINVEQLSALDQAVTFSSTRQPTFNEPGRRVSMDQFSQNSQSNELLKAIRYLAQVNDQVNCYLKPEQMRYNWGKLDPSVVAKHIISICGQIKEVFMREARLLDLSSPVYVMGDLHGNFADLLYFERVFWHVGPGLCPCSLLFLGDYVDRGFFSVEVITYLFCYKLQTPKKLSMIRGNHEIKKVQVNWTFEKECKIKFGPMMGTAVFNAINDAFNTMPLAAVIDGRIFCCHGGIPPPWLCPVATAINEIPVNLTEPQDQSSLAWELMWNDPLRPKHMNDKVALELVANDGFATNTRRGTAHVFNVEALEKFLQANGFTHLLRAHEVVEAGFYVQQKGKLLTVFSTSKYCGGQNEAACILADQAKLRILRLETHK